MSARGVARSLIALVVVIGLALVGVAAGSAIAQTVPGQDAGIVATGFGRASGPATAAEVQILVGRDMYGYGPMEMMPPDEDEAVASPVAGEGDVGMTGWAPYAPVALTEADVAPIVDAVVAAGVPEDRITIVIPASFSTYGGPAGPDSAQIRFSMANPVVDNLANLARGAQQAARDAGLSVQHVGVRYLGEDCDTLQQQARVAAVADARNRAKGLAQALGVELGDLVQAADGSFFSPYGADDPAVCASQLYSEFGYGPGVDDPFDPTQPAEVVIFATVTLTFAIGSGDSTASA